MGASGPQTDRKHELGLSSWGTGQTATLIFGGPLYLSDLWMFPWERRALTQPRGILPRIQPNYWIVSTP